jgi:general secretion pathway protein D
VKPVSYGLGRDMTKQMRGFGARGVVILLLVSTLLACATPDTPRDPEITVETNGSSLAQRVERTASIMAAAEAQSEPQLSTQIIRGDGRFIDTEAARRVPADPAEPGEVTLNFELADIRDVVKIIFDTLEENYVIDPRVRGEVTVQTSRPLPRDALLPTLETLLRQVGAVLMRSEGVYRVVPAATAATGGSVPRLMGDNVPPGYGVKIFPLRYISAAEMETILRPFAPEGGILLVEPARNLIILAGTRQELNDLQETIEIFDVNWLQGMSVGFYPLDNIDAQEVTQELDQLFGPDSGLPFAGLFRFVPITRLNAVLVITPQADYLREATVWIERLDSSGGERLYVYRVQNSNAEYLASLLDSVFDVQTSGGATPRPATSGQVAPGQQTGRIGSGNEIANLALLQMDDNPDTPASEAPRVNAGRLDQQLRITADTENNALLIWASSQQYERVLAALRQIDVPKRQVLIEAIIAEVTLADELQYGLQWFFKNNRVGGQYTGFGSQGLDGTSATIGDNGALGEAGFSYALTDSAGLVRALLTTLAGDSLVRVLSSPQIMVIDNQQARIRVGDQQPVRGPRTIGTDSNVLTETFQFKDTGVTLQVQPNINAGGLVTMDIDQEVTDVGPEDSATGQRSFLQRQFTSKVAVQSGETIVLGGLIRERQFTGSSGVPVLHEIPLVGGLFGTKNRDFGRTELVVLITPRVIADSREASQATAEIRERMRGIIPLDSPWRQPLEMPSRLH